MQNIELLAPAGSYEALVAAIQNGANAIYLGGNEFSARAFATNFNREELQKAVDYSHLRNVKIYVTVNTLYEDNQFKQLHDYLLFLANINVDALIIQDIGLMDYVKKYFPQFEIHMSTQTSVHNLEGVKYFEEKGVDRVVLARENTVAEIKNICQNTDLDIEVFVHGALCMSYSGQCLMSSMIAKRSGNKGACGQPCRLAYKLQKNGQDLNEQPLYLLSPKDLCTIENIDQLIEAGITSFKIEGRMKRPEYVAIVVKQYREAIDAYCHSKKLNNIPERILKMKKMFNRGFTGGYLLNDQSFMAKDFPGNRGIEVAKVISYDGKKRIVKLKLLNELKQGDRINFASIELTRTITKLFEKGRLVNSSQKGKVVEIELNQPVKTNEKVFKIIDNNLIEEAKASYNNENIKNSIDMIFIGTLNSTPLLTIKYQDLIITIKSNQKIESASNVPLDTQRIFKQLTKLGNTVFNANKIDIDFPDNAFFPIKEINEMRRQGIEQLIQKITLKNKINIEYPEVSLHHVPKRIKGIDVRVYNLKQLEALINEDIHRYYFPLSKDLDKAIDLATGFNKKIVPFTGFLSNSKQLNEFKESDLYCKVDEILVGDYGALQIFNDKKCLLDFNFNLYNSYSLNYFNNYAAVLSLEMSKNMINNLNDINQELILVAYGKTINMHLKHCIISDYYFNCKKEKCNLCHQGHYNLVDRKNEKFTILTDDNCNNLVFNSHCLYLENISDVDVDYILLSFSDENCEECKKVFYDFQNNIILGKPRQIKLKTRPTNGYFYD